MKNEYNFARKGDKGIFLTLIFYSFYAIAIYLNLFDAFLTLLSATDAASRTSSQNDA